MDFKDFSLYSTASRVKNELRGTPRTDAQIRVVVKKRAQLELALARLSAYIADCEKQQQDALEPVAAAMAALIGDSNFEPDRRDKEIVRSVNALILDYAEDYEDIKKRYNADCLHLAQKIEHRQFNVLKYTGAKYRLTKEEKLERKKRLHLEEEEQILQECNDNIKEHKSIIRTLSDAKQNKKREIADSLSEHSGILLLRELKVLERKISEQQNLIALNTRIVDTIEAERYHRNLGQLLAVVNEKRQLKLLKRAQQLYEKEKMVQEAIKVTDQSMQALMAAPVQVAELDEVRELKKLPSKQKPAISFKPIEVKTQKQAQNSQPAIEAELLE